MKGQLLLSYIESVLFADWGLLKKKDNTLHFTLTLSGVTAHAVFIRACLTF